MKRREKKQVNHIGMFLIIINKKMKKVWEDNSNASKLLEEKCEAMNKAIGLNNISIKEDLTLLINGRCAEQIKTLHKEYPSTEWLALCKIEPQGSWAFLMTAMIFPQQKGVGVEVETTKEWMEWQTKELINRGEDLRQWNCILHSHHSMGCFWSWTDDKARLGLNDWRQLAWAVVTSYNNWVVTYKGCLNFYKPYNIEIDATVKNEIWNTICEQYWKYKDEVWEVQQKFYNSLLEENKEYIDSITAKPSYKKLLDYLDLDIEKELAENYNTIKDKIWNPELKEYLSSLSARAWDLAEWEVNNDWRYNDMLVEYSEFCLWSDNLLEQLEKHREKTYTSWSNYSYTTLPRVESKVQPPVIDELRDFNSYEEAEYYGTFEFTSNKYAESFVRQMFNVPYNIPMKVWDRSEWEVWCDECWDYIYVEDWADYYWF